MMPSASERSLANRIRSQLRRDTADLVDFAAALIRIPSENPPGESYAGCAALVASRLRQMGLSTQTVDPSGHGPSVLGTFGESGLILYFSGHYDVVPSHDPAQFRPVLRKGILRGRGSADMKGGIAAMAFAIHALARAGFEPAGRIVSVSVPDEETSGPRGTVALAKAGLIDRSALGMLTMEPTSGVVWNANRGVLSVRVTVRGRPAHVGLHFRGANAFRGLLDVAGELTALERAVQRRRTRFPISPDAARRSVLLLGGEISGGHNFNVVPARASFTVDRRTNPEEDFDRERRRLFDAIGHDLGRGVRAEVEILQEGRSSVTSARGPLARALDAAIRGVTGRTARFELCPGALETRHYAALGIPALAYGPGLLSVSHGPHEFVHIKRLLDCALIYALTAVRLLS
jgi:acetylornithine deacetylase/succinyl-diaminopimelate desuccinylase family protein